MNYSNVLLKLTLRDALKRFRVREEDRSRRTLEAN